ncbi:MAG: hypothetical protein HYX78_00635 [Armatimonadetes bacterium]|nr:hypothetical protein [Armatimonadota bacterium]
MAVRRLLKNWPYKLLALGTAVLLTSYVHGERNPTITSSTRADVHIEHVQQGYDAEVTPRNVTISLEGPKSDVETALQAVKSNEIRALVDLAGLNAGRYTVPVRISAPESLARGVSVRTATEKVTAQIEERSSRTLPVEVKLKNPLPIGYATSEATVAPAKATITGSSSIVSRIRRLVAVVRATPLQPSVDDYVVVKALDGRNEEVRGIKIAPEGVHVTLKLVEAPANKSVFVSPIVVGQPQFPYRVARISVTPNSVIIKGKPESLAGTTTVATDEVDLAGAAADVVRYVKLHVPPGLEVEDPDQVRVTVKIVQSPGTRTGSPEN